MTVTFDEVLEEVLNKKKTCKRERIERFINAQYERHHYINLDEKQMLLNVIQDM